MSVVGVSLGDSVKAGAWTFPVLALLVMGGCMFSEQSFPYEPSSRVVVEGSGGESQTTRQWLARSQSQLEPLLPKHRHNTHITEELVAPDGTAEDVGVHFDRDPAHAESLVFNFRGLAYSAQASMPHGPEMVAPPWEGFDDVWIPVDDELELAGRIGWARDADGEPIDATCIVILPGIRGNNNILRVRDLAKAMHVEGFHVLTLELRGTGQTDVRFPEYDYTWGVYETDDLLVVADWLQAKPQVTRTGLVGYSWGANHALMVAWADGRTDDAGIPVMLRGRVGPAAPEQRRYEAGVIAFSPAVRHEELADKLAVERSVLSNPAMAGLQKTFRDRMIEKGYPNPSGDVRELIRRADVGYADPLADIVTYTRVMPHEGMPACVDLEQARIPVLIVHASDDPIVPAQDIADLIATVENPDVAAIMTPRGGHIGFAPYASVWYYNLILNYFDPAVGAGASQDAP
jgi:dienelactone hydrolase